MSTIQLERTLESLSKIISVDEEKKKELFSKFSGMNDAEVIKELSQIVYRILGTNQELYDYSLTVIRNIMMGKHHPFGKPCSSGSILHIYYIMTIG